MLRGILTLALVGWMAAPASAQELCRLVGFAAEPRLECSEQSCEPGDDCADAGEDLEATCATRIGVCRPRCGTLLTCTDDGDCIDVEGRCVDVDGGTISGGRGFCEAGTSPLCRASVTAITEAELIKCFTLPFSDSIAPSWIDGDCDHDGCPNGNDEDPCDPAMRGCTRFAGEEAVLTCDSRLVGVDGPESCVVSGAGLSCATLHECVGMGGCPTGFTCQDDMRCHPSTCSTLFACRSDDDCVDQVDRGLTGGICVPVLDRFPMRDPRDGLCAYPAFTGPVPIACAASFTACVTTPDGALTMDLFAGDCDGDRCPNGIDDTPCEHGFSRCLEDVSPACGTPLFPPPTDDDAGMEERDATMTLDAAGIDGGNLPFDGGARPDGSATRVTFGGGGGCVCAAGARRSGSSALVGLALLGALWARRRRALRA